VLAAAPGLPVAEVARAIEQRARGGPLPGGDRPGRSLRAGLERLYAPLGWTPVWVDGNGKPRSAANDALAAIAAAADDGLDPDEYGVAPLRALADTLRAPLATDPDRIAWFDVALSAAFLTLAGDLHLGRIDPRTAGFQLDLPADRHDLPALVAAAAADGRIQPTLEDLRPQFALYGRTRLGLRQYRQIAADVTWDPLPVPATPVLPGESPSWLPALAQRLRILGDLPADDPVDTVYGGALAAAVRRFQERHGLAPDGVVGRATMEAVNVPPSVRAAQLALSLERLRWLPDLGQGPLIAVNIPSFHLWAWDSVGADATPSLDMNVIVGRQAVGTRTPVFIEEMRYVVLRPYWDVPPGILRSEVLPSLRADTAYLRRNDMEIVQGLGDDARAVAPTPENIELLARGHLRVRQRPGPRNSMGLAKFIFPNDANVYLHGTPAQELFSRARRDFSHGCVRVEDPVALAEHVLRDVPGWDRARIVAAMIGGRPTRVNLARPIPVVLFYTTAIVTPEGTVGFYEDIYGHDARLAGRLRP
jgi:murein L,D-transpeptidase YcbB/YkuD